MGSKEEYLDSLLNSVMKESDENRIRSSSAESSEKPEASMENENYDELDGPMTPADEMLALLDQLERAERGEAPEPENSPVGMTEEVITPEELPLSDISELTDIPELSDMPELADIPGLSDMSELTDIPELSDIPELTDLPKLSDIPEFTDMPELSDMPGLTDIPELPDMPEVTDMPEDSGMFGMEEKTDELPETNTYTEEAADPAMNDLFDLFASEREEIHTEQEEKTVDLFSDAMTSNPDLQDEMSDEDLVKSLFAGEEEALFAEDGASDADGDNGADWEALLEPTESKGEEKARKKQEKQEARAKIKEEKAKQKEEKARQKAEKASAKKASKKGKSAKEEIAEQGELSAEEELLLMAESAMAQEEAEGQPKKQGFFGKLFGGLLEEVQDEEELVGIDISDENMAIMEEVGNEEIAPQADKKKGKKDKKKKGKKDKKEDKEKSPDGDDAEDDEKQDKKSIKAAKKKAKKAMKEEMAALEGPVKKLPRKKVMSIFAVCFTLFGIILLCSLFVPSYFGKKEARRAYYNGDYEKAYELFSGEKLSGSDAILYERTVFVLYFDNKLDAYELNMSIGREKEAVNELLSAVSFYQANLEDMIACDALDEVQPGYMKILALLSDIYGVSEERAVEIAGYEVLDYNKALYELLTGTEFTIPEMQEENVQEDTAESELAEPKPEDILPEEEELLQSEESNMIDNSTETDTEASEDAEENAAEDAVDETTGDVQPEEALLYSGTIEDGQVIVQ